jgi:putative ABC transport system permease protein
MDRWCDLVPQGIGVEVIHYLRALAARLQGLFGSRKVDQELDDEIETHLRLLTERYVRQGMTEADAAWAARRQFGNITLLKEANREMRGISFIETFVQDLRYGLWMLRRNPGFTSVAVLTLALGIGANTAIFSIVNAVLLKPLPYPDPQRLVWITEVLHGAELNGAADYIHWREQSKTFDHLTAFTTGQIYLTGRGEPERLDVVRATANLVPALGIAPQLGRAFTPEEDRPVGDPVVILSHALWQRRFGGDPSVIGQSVTLDGRDRVVIGVMPPGFKFIRKADALLPRAIDVQDALKNEGMRYAGEFIGRLKPGVSVKQARSELDLILERLAQEKPNRLYGERTIMTPLGEKLVGNLRQGLLAQFGAVGFILLIACANIANLLLARANVRRKEMAIRAAMGAGRGRLVRQMLTESLLLSVFGGLAGLFLSLAGVKALTPLIPDNLAHLKGSGPLFFVNGAALGFTFLASLLTGVVAGIIPAIQASRIDLNESLKEGARGVAFSRRQGAWRVSPALVVAELALTLALLTGAGLLIKSYVRAQAVAPGFSTENLLTMTIPLRVARYPLAQRKIINQDLLTRINSLPGVKVAAIGPIPMTEIRTAMDGRSESDSQNQGIGVYYVSDDYFRAMGMPLRMGRSFTEQDNESAPPVVVVNEATARNIYPGENPIGKLVDYQFPDREIQGTIVGVVADVKSFGLEANAPAMEYRLLRQNTHLIGGELVIRTAGDPLNLVPAVRQQVREINPNIPVVDVMSMEQRLANSHGRRRFQTMLFGLFAAVALAIATVGIYGVISYGVSQRTHEIGIRMALGAQARDVLRMVVRRGMILTLIGAALGLGTALALTRVMKNLLFGVSATDPATFALIALLLVVVALIASYIPARRATKVDPLQALRHE